MTIRTRLVLITGTWVVFGFAFGVLAIEVSPYFLIVAVVLMLIAGELIRRTKCPACSTPVLRRDIRIAGVTIPFYVTTVPTECHHCGHQLDGGDQS